MPETRTKRLRHMAEAEAAGQIAPDASIAVHTFADGWTIRRLMTCGDVRREGLIMRNCLAVHAGDELDPKRKGEITKRSDRVDADALIELTEPTYPLRGRHVHAHLYSLRDDRGLPHLTFWSRPGSHITDTAGFRNEKFANLKPAYLQRLGEWAQLHSARVVADCDLWNTMCLDGLHMPSSRNELARTQSFAHLTAQLRWDAIGAAGSARVGQALVQIPHLRYEVAGHIASSARASARAMRYMFPKDDPELAELSPLQVERLRKTEEAKHRHHWDAKKQGIAGLTRTLDHLLALTAGCRAGQSRELAVAAA